MPETPGQDAEPKISKRQLKKRRKWYQKELNELRKLEAQREECRRELEILERYKREREANGYT